MIAGTKSSKECSVLCSLEKKRWVHFLESVGQSSGAIDLSIDRRPKSREPDWGVVAPPCRSRSAKHDVVPNSRHVVRRWSIHQPPLGSTIRIPPACPELADEN
jgi:hypothetical protein